MADERQAPPVVVRLSSIEYCMAVLTLGWGAWVLFWGADAAVSAPAFDGLREGLTWGVWEAWQVIGLGGVFVGLSHLVGVTINGHGPMWTPITRLCAGMANVFFFAYVARALWTAQESSTGVYTYAMIAVAYALVASQNSARVIQSFKLVGRAIKGRLNG